MLPLLLLWMVVPETAETIMTKVAANQERAESERERFVYQQSVLVRVKNGLGKLVREESRVYTVTPTATGARRDLMESKSSPEKAWEIDRELAAEFAQDVTSGRSRDGLQRGHFPLTADKQKQYSFRLVGRETYRDRPVYHLAFNPLPKGGSAWKGDLLVDEQEFQPVLVTTQLDAHIPIVVRTVLGTNVQHLGFRLAYRSVEGTWFPESYSGEMKIRALFLFQRRVGVAMRNTDFKRGEVDSQISYQSP